MKSRTNPNRRAVVALTLAALAVAGCSGGSAPDVDKAWARSSPMMASAGAAYMEISNGGAADALTGASVAASIAGRVELHESRPAEGGNHGSTPMMEMVHVERIEIPAGGRVMLEPGGFHIMLLGLAEPLANGTELEITLSFEKAGELKVVAIVGDGAP